jgi:tRNA 5-methylaminomethyl-2-thiouridine biosynthesis bifunctional protein
MYRDLLKKCPIGHLGGVLQLAYHEKERSHQSNLAHWLSLYPSLGKIVDKKEASIIAGIPISNSALFLPLSGFINIPALCKSLVHCDEITWIGGCKIDQIAYADGLWHLCDEKAPVLILANGFSASSFKETAHLPLKPIRGQMTTIKVSDQSAQLKVPLCADAHILPAINGCHDLGATYYQDNDSNLAMPEDDALNMSKLSAISDQILWSDEVIDQWVGVRAAAPDYLPMIGPVADKDRFKEQYQAMQGDPKRFIQTASDCYPGLYIAAGFGSRGLTSIPICADWLASIIHGDPTNCTRSMMQSLSPSRFLRRELIRG